MVQNSVTPRMVFLKILTNLFWHYMDRFSHSSIFLADFYEHHMIGKEYQAESQLFNLSREDVILHIGCGSYPLTEITLASSLGATVVGIDKNKAAVHRAQKTIQDKQLTDKITITYGNGINYPINDYSIVIISSCSYPKLQILDHILSQAKSHTKIIVREIQLASEKIITYLNHHDNLALIKMTTSNPLPFISPFGWYSFLLQKK